MTDFEGLIRRLGAADVRFVLIGGFAGTVLGSPRTTVDLDIVYARDDENLARLVDTLGSLSPRLRGAPDGLPFVLDVDTLARGLNFTLTTSLGDLDLLGEVVGGGTYEELLPHTLRLSVFDTEMAVVTVEDEHRGSGLRQLVGLDAQSRAHERHDTSGEQDDCQGAVVGDVEAQGSLAIGGKVNVLDQRTVDVAARRDERIRVKEGKTVVQPVGGDGQSWRRIGCFRQATGRQGETETGEQHRRSCELVRDRRH